MNITISSSRKNQRFEFVPEKAPDFPLKNFESVSGDVFFEDENNLVLYYCLSLFFIVWLK